MFTKNQLTSLALTLGLVVSTAGSVASQEHEHGQKPAEKTKDAPKEFKGDPYLLDTDPVSGEKLGPVEKQIVIDHEGRELRFASDQNAKSFRADPGKYLAQVDAKLIEQQKPFYALTTCPVSGDKLGGDMGAPVDFVYRNRLVRFCCPDCKASFLKDPAKFVAKIDEAVIAAQAKSYPLKTCVVSGEEFGGEMGDPIDFVVGNRLLRLCCPQCAKKVSKDPLKYLAALGKPNEAGAHHDDGDGHGHDDHKGHDHGGK
jgi:YHS domain-containing protein